MNKTIIININSIVFHIEEDAYETLRTYMIDIKKHFGNSAESKEILEDIENRIAEMFNERIQTGRKEVINLEDVQQVIGQMGRVSDFEENEDTSEGFQQEQTQTVPPSFANEHTGKKLMRDPDDKVLGGVCSGLAHYFGMEPRWIRILLVLFVLIGGSGFLVYLVLWIIMPEAATRADKMAMRGEEPNLQNFKKSFDEEAKSFSEGIADAGAHIGRVASNAGSALGGCLGFIGKAIAWIMLIYAGIVLLGLFIVYIFNMMNFFGLENPIFFPPLEALSSEDGVVALTFGVLAIGIPFLALFLWLVRVLFKTDKLNNYLSLTMFAVWIVSIFGIIYYCVSTSQDFREESTINVQKNLVAQKVYLFTEKDVRVLDASTTDSLKSKFNIELEGQDLRNHLRNDVRINFESIDSLAQPYIQYNYKAKGRTYRLAAERAKGIVYEALQEGNTFIFPSHFILKKNDLERDQRVRVTVYLPRGAKVVLQREIENKVNDVDCWDCVNNYSDPDHQKFSEWKMAQTGLVCLQPEPPKEDEEDKENEDTEEVTVTEAKNVNTKKDSVIKIDGSNVTIEVKDNNVKINTEKKEKQ